MKAAQILLLTISCAATAQAQRWCFGLPCVQSPRLDFTAGRDYQHAPVFHGEPVIVPPYRRVPQLEPLSVTKQFFTLGTPTRAAIPAPRIVLPPALPGVVHAPIQPVSPPAVQLLPMTAAPAPVNPNTGSFSTGVGMPSFTPGGPK